MNLFCEMLPKVISAIKYLIRNCHCIFLFCYSDAMETDEKAGSSPAGKPTESVRLLILTSALSCHAVFCLSVFIGGVFRICLSIIFLFFYFRKMSLKTRMPR